MNKTKSIIVFSIISSLFFTSCKKQDLEIGKTNISSNQIYTVSNVPYANDQELNAIAQNDNNVHFEIARKMALIDLELSIKQSMGWNGTNLSEKPVVIYDSKSEAKYYEFIVKNQNGEGLGTITTCAKKEADATVSHILPYVRNYSSVLTKGSNYKIISGGYPNTLYTGVLSKSGEEASVIVDPTTGNVVTDVLTEDAKGVIEKINNMSDEDLLNLNITSRNDIIQQVIDKDKLNKEYAETYWALVDSIKIQLDTMSDKTLISTLSSKNIFNSWSSYDEFVIPKYAQNYNLKATFWSGWCGPSALAIIYKGLYDSYKGFYLPINGEDSFEKEPIRYYTEINNSAVYDFGSGTDDDNDGLANGVDKNWIDKTSKEYDGGLYADLANYSKLYLVPNLTKYFNKNFASNNAPTFPGNMSSALSYVTDGKYKIFYTKDVHSMIRNNQLPAISLVEGMSHWVVAIGSKYEYFNWEVVMKLFKKKIVLAKGVSRTGKFLYFMDNGFTTGSNNYLPYWENDVLKFYMDYAVTKN